VSCVKFAGFDPILGVFTLKQIRGFRLERIRIGGEERRVLSWRLSAKVFNYCETLVASGRATVLSPQRSTGCRRTASPKSLGGWRSGGRRCGGSWQIESPGACNVLRDRGRPDTGPDLSRWATHKIRQTSQMGPALHQSPASRQAPEVSPSLLLEDSYTPLAKPHDQCTGVSSLLIYIIPRPMQRILLISLQLGQIFQTSALNGPGKSQALVYLSWIEGQSQRMESSSLSQIRP
jgi:hypothetical protein